MGLLDLPAPLFAVVDDALAAILLPQGRFVVWAGLGGCLSILLYALLSPQRHIATAKTKALAARRALLAYDGDFAGALPLMVASFKAALRQLGLVAPAALVSALPVVSLVLWIETVYGHGFPPLGQAPAIHTEPRDLATRWHEEKRMRKVEVLASTGQSVAKIRLIHPVTRIHKRHWWNFLVGNPAGYLPQHGPAEIVEIALPERDYLGIGPTWLRSWATIFVPALILSSLVLHRVARLA